MTVTYSGDVWIPHVSQELAKEVQSGMCIAGSCTESLALSCQGSWMAIRPDIS